MATLDCRSVRCALLALGGVVLTSCGTSLQTMSFSHETTRPAPEAFSCVNGMLNALSYVVLDGNRDVGYLRAQRKVSNVGLEPNVDTIYASVYEDPSTAKRMVRVTVETDFAGRRRDLTEPSDALKADAQKVLETCAK